MMRVEQTEMNGVSRDREIVENDGIRGAGDGECGGGEEIERKRGLG
jgi:hypothetical protein